MESTAIQQAARYAAAVAEFRTLYTSEVVKTAVAHGLQVTHDYLNKAGAIPFRWRQITLRVEISQAVCHGRSAL